MKRRVVVTGIGMITPCGEGWAPFWTAAVKAQSHIGFLSQLSIDDFPSRLGGEITGFDLGRFLKNRKSLKVMSKTIQLAVGASYYAIEDAGIKLQAVDLERFGISLGTGIINNELDELGVGVREAISESGHFDIRKFGQSGIRSLFPLWFLKYLPNMPACHISITHGLKGPSNTLTTSSAAGAQAIGEAFHVIQRGDADLMLAGSSDSKINPIGISRFHLLGLLSRETQHPENAYRPFDERHSGMILGEGAGLLILEEAEHAKRRGAKIYAEVAGYGSASDFNYDPSKSEDYTGKCLAMSRALEDGATGPEEVDALLAHGSGIPREDVQEADAVRSVFDETVDRLKVTGVKPIAGHMVYGAGGVEFAAAVLSIKEKMLPPLANFEKPARACELPFVLNKPNQGKMDSLLFNAFGFGGQNASILVRQYD